MIENNKPRVTVCVIVFNQAQYILDCLHSIAAQKFSFAYDVVIRDDASTDGSSAIIADFISKNRLDNFVLHSVKKNEGMMQNFLNALKLCKGKYIAFCEGDDFWIDPYKLQKQVDFLDANDNYGLVWTDINFLKQSSLTTIKSVFGRKILKIFDSFQDTIVNKPYFSPPTWLFRRTYIDNTLDYATKKYNDGTFPFILDILVVTKIKYLNEVTATYRQLEESASNSKSMKKRYEFAKGIYRIQKDYLRKYPQYAHLETLIDYRHHLSTLPYALIVGDSEGVDQGRNVLEKSSYLLAKVFLFMSRSTIGVKLIVFIYNNSILKQALSKFFLHGR